MKLFKNKSTTELNIINFQNLLFKIHILETGTASNHQWNLFNHAVNNSADVRHQKFLVRLRFYPGLIDPTLYTMVGHVTRETRSYYHAADSYAEALKANPNCPFIRLYLATVYTHIAAQVKYYHFVYTGHAP